MFPSEVPNRVRIPSRDAAPIASGGRSRVLAHAARLTLCCLLGAAAAPSQVVGTVQTTSSLGILPNGNDNTPALQAAFAAFGNNHTFIFDVPGTYRLKGPMGSPAPILALSNKSGVTIEAVAGVKILLTGYDRSVQDLSYPNVLQITECVDFTLRGASPATPLVFDTEGANPAALGVAGLPFLQGKLVSVKANLAPPVGAPPVFNEAQIEVTDSAMFLPTTCTPKVWSAWQSDPNQGPRHTWGRFGTAVPVGPVFPGTNNVPTQLVDIRYPAAGFIMPFAQWTVGSQVVAILNESEKYTVIAHACKGKTRIENLLAHHLPGKFVTVAHSDDVEVRSVSARPAIASRRLSVNRDGLNAGGHRLLVRDCHMEHVGDDGIVAQAGPWGSVVPGSATINLAGLWEVTLTPPVTIINRPTLCRNGDLMAFLDGTTLDPGTAEWGVVASHTQIPNSTPLQLRYTFLATSPNLPMRLLNTTALAPTVTYNPMYSALGGLVENCSVVGPRGIGIVVRSLNTTVSGCAITDTAECGIHAGGGMVEDYPWWGNGAPPHNLIVQGCTLTRCGIGGVTKTKGAIEIAVAQSGQQILVPCNLGLMPFYASTPDVIQNVTLDDNTIVDYPRAGIFAANVGGTNGIVITNNRFVNAGGANSCHPEYGHCVALETCGAGLIQSNTYTNYVGKYWQNASGNVVWLP